MNPGDYRLVVSSGPTREWIDPVRYISNASSGKTGWNLARLGLPLFRETVFVSGPVAEKYARVEGARNIPVESTADMGAALAESLEDATIVVMAAAPADYSCAGAPAKIKKTSDELVLRLSPAMDILAALREKAAALRDCHLIGFAAETENLYENALGKLRKKGLRFICANEVFRTSKGFGENQNQWQVIDGDGRSLALGPAPKEALARELLELLIREIN